MMTRSVVAIAVVAIAVGTLSIRRAIVYTLALLALHVCVPCPYNFASKLNSAVVCARVAAATVL